MHKNNVKSIFILLVCGLVLGCEFSLPLSKAPQMDIDDGLIGLWSRTTQGETKKLLVLPLNEKKCLVEFLAGEKNAIYAKAWLCEVADMKLTQLRWFGTAKGTLPKEELPEGKKDLVYQYVKYSLSEDTLTFTLLNSNALPNDITTREDLVQAIVDNKDNPNLFRDELVFTRVEN